MKKHLISVALLVLLMLLIPTAAWADVIYPAPQALTVGVEVDHLLATLDPGGTVWADPEHMPQGLFLETREDEGGVRVYLRGTPEVAGDYDLVIVYSGITSICPLHILPGEEPDPVPVPERIEVETLPARLDYMAGDSLDPEGLSLRMTMSDGSTAIVTEGYSLYPRYLENAGTQTVEVSYGGLLCYFDVEVAPAPEIVEGIGVLTLPVKVIYEVGERLETTGLSVRVYTNNGTRDVEADELECEPILLEEAGAQLITVSYAEKTCSFTVQVLREETPAAMAVYRLPQRLDYEAGEALDTTGLILVVTSDRDQVEYLDEGFVCEPQILSEPGYQEIRVYFGELVCSYHVLVHEAAPTPAVIPTPETGEVPPSVAPIVTAVPVPSTEPGPETVPERAPETEPQPAHRPGRTLVAVLVIAAVLAVGVLGGYVLLQVRSGDKYLAESIRDLFRRR